MIAMLTEQQTAAIRGFEKVPTETEGMDLSQACFLSELPGAVFGVVTVIWIVSTLSPLIR